MNIEDLYHRLVAAARQRVSSGEVSERGLARICDISQPHMHHVLKEVRSLSPASANRLMKALGLSVPALLWRYPDETEAGILAVPVLRGRIGPGGDPVLTSFRGYTPLPLSLVEGLVDPVAARLAPDLVMPARFAANDFALLDQNPALRLNPAGSGCWVVAVGDMGLRIRYVRVAGSERARPGAILETACEPSPNEPRRWQPVPLQGRNILDIVRARIVWVGREMEKEPVGPSEPAGGGDRTAERS